MKNLNWTKSIIMLFIANLATHCSDSLQLSQNETSLVNEEEVVEKNEESSPPEVPTAFQCDETREKKEPFAEGEGTEQSPYLVCSDLQLDQVRNHLSSHFKLMNHLNLEGKSFQPIGQNATPFQGVFDGNNLIISHFSYQISPSATSETYVGLFGVIYNGTIKNLGLENVSINSLTTRRAVGGLAGYARNATILNSYTTGEINGIEKVGGLVGQLGEDYDSKTGQFVPEGSSIIHTYSKASVSGHSRVGGLVGESRQSLIEESYSSGPVVAANHGGGLVGITLHQSYIYKSYSTSSVTNINLNVPAGTSLLGGLVGFFVGDSSIYYSYATGSVTSQYDWVGGLVGVSSGLIKDSYATGKVSGRDFVGGLVGEMKAGSMFFSYSIGMVSGSNSVGGLIGKLVNPSTVTSSYWDTDTSEMAISGGGTGKTTSEMKMPSTFSFWNFTNIWKIDNNYPTLR